MACGKSLYVMSLRDARCMNCENKQTASDKTRAIQQHIDKLGD